MPNRRAPRDCNTKNPTPLSCWSNGCNREPQKREFFIDNLLVRIHFLIVMIRWTGLAPWEFEFPFPGSLTATFLQNVKFLAAVTPPTKFLISKPSTLNPKS